MKSRLFVLLGSLAASSAAWGCGLDWSLPTNHFDGVNQQGYVSYWEKIAEADLGDGLVIPLNINFSSHRETSSPTLGKGWMVALLESHVEPVDENTMKVIMPDGWNFYFLRKGNTENWGGNAGWVGETDGSRFTITAPCGWRVKFDGGKIEEIDSPKNRTISYKYNGPEVTEVDVDTKPFVQVESNTATGVAEDILIGGQKVGISLAQRPNIQSVLGKTLITGFDPSLSELQWPDGKKESFSFGTPKELTPTLAITKTDNTQRNITWDPLSRFITKDGDWTYRIKPDSSNPQSEVTRTNGKGQSEFYSENDALGTVITQGLNGTRTITRSFVNAGPLSGRLRDIVQIKNGVTTIARRNDYDEQGRLIRAFVLMTKPHEFTYKYNALGKQSEIDVDKKLWITKTYDSQGRLLEKDLANGIKMTYAYVEDKVEKTTFLKNGKTIVVTLNKNFHPIEDLATSEESIIGKDK